MIKGFHIESTQTSLYANGAGSTSVWSKDLTLNVADTYKNSVNSGSFVPGVFRVNPYQVSQGEFEEVSKSIRYIYYIGSTKYTHDIRGDIGSYMFYQCSANLPAFDSFASLRSRAVLRAESKIGAMDLNVVEDLAELGTTLEMLRHPLGGLRDFLLSPQWKNLRSIHSLQRVMKHGLPSNVVKRNLAALLSAGSSDWLQFQYGIKPLISEIKSLAELVAKVDKRIFDPSKIRVKRAKIPYSSNYKVSAPLNALPTCSAPSTLEVEDEVTVRATVNFRQSHPFGWSEFLGLSPEYWPEIVWELTRLSFVLDWVYNVGSWIGAHRSMPKVDVLGRTSSVKLNRKVSLYAKTKPGSVPEVYSGPLNFGLLGRYRRETFHRYVESGTPPPQFTVNAVGLSQTVDALALIIQAIVGKWR